MKTLDEALKLVYDTATTPGEAEQKVQAIADNLERLNPMMQEISDNEAFNEMLEEWRRLGRRSAKSALFSAFMSGLIVGMEMEKQDLPFFGSAGAGGEGNRMNRVIVNVACGQSRYIRWQDRLIHALDKYAPDAGRMLWTGRLPEGSPSHAENNYAFKAWALTYAALAGADQLMWIDSSTYPVAPLELIWHHAATYGVWMPKNSFEPEDNYTWTADQAYPALFRWFSEAQASFDYSTPFPVTDRMLNMTIPHCATTAFALDLRHARAQAFLGMFMEYAAAGAFHGPWMNQVPRDGQRLEDLPKDPSICAPCGPPGVYGHRHDQTAASVACWRLGVELVPQPRYLAYYGKTSAETILVADGREP